MDIQWTFSEHSVDIQGTLSHLFLLLQLHGLLEHQLAARLVLRPRRQRRLNLPLLGGGNQGKPREIQGLAGNGVGSFRERDRDLCADSGNIESKLRATESHFPKP